MPKILQHKHPEEDEILRKKASKVTAGEFGTPELKRIVSTMKEMTHNENDGVAMAAPQIGISKQIVVIDAERSFPAEAKWRPDVFINPQVVKVSNKLEVKDEGCLSVRGTFGNTWRAKQITVKAQDENGNLFTYGAGGLMAHILQHEIDHLNGILFIDHGFDFRDDPDHPASNY